MGKSSNATNHVVDFIKDNIRNGTWPVGSKIPSEMEICKALGVSRMSVRSALQPFIVLSIMASYQGKGTFVLSSDLSRLGHSVNCLINNLKDVKESLEFRSMVEPQVCELVARHISQKTIDYLDTSLKAMMSQIGHSEDFVKSDMDFHLELCRATGNHILLTLMKSVLTDHDQLQLQLNTAIGYYGGVYYHTMLVKALKEHNGKLAASIMKEHLQQGISDLNEAVIPPDDKKKQ